MLQDARKTVDQSEVRSCHGDGYTPIKEQPTRPEVRVASPVSDMGHKELQDKSTTDIQAAVSSKRTIYSLYIDIFLFSIIFLHEFKQTRQPVDLKANNLHFDTQPALKACSEQLYQLAQFRLFKFQI